MILRRLPAFGVAAAFAVFAASALAGSFAVKLNYQITGTITNADPVFVNPPGALTRRQCGTGWSSAGSTGTFHYKAYRFKGLNGWYSGGTGTPGIPCVNISLLVQSGTAAANAYNSFDPAAPASTLRGGVPGLAAGQSADFATENLVGVTVPWTFDVVVYETTPNGGASYTLLVEGPGIIMTGGPPTASTGLASFLANSTRDGVRVTWQTRSEQGALGFNVYRGKAKKIQVTRSLVRASDDGHGHSYSFTDRSASKKAPYYLEIVQRNGSKVMFGPALFR